MLEIQLDQQINTDGTNSCSRGSISTRFSEVLTCFECPKLILLFSNISHTALIQCVLTYPHRTAKRMSEIWRSRKATIEVVTNRSVSAGQSKSVSVQEARVTREKDVSLLTFMRFGPPYRSHHQDCHIPTYIHKVSVDDAPSEIVTTSRSPLVKRDLTRFTAELWNPALLHRLSYSIRKYKSIVQRILTRGIKYILTKSVE